LSIGQGGLILQGVEFWHSPLTKAVAVNTVLRYRGPVTSTNERTRTALSNITYIQFYNEMRLCAETSKLTDVQQERQ